jgi:hypothetical protein
MEKTENTNVELATTNQTEPVKNPNESTIELDTPIVRGTTTIASVTVRKPMAGELRGCSLVDLLNLEVNTLRKVLPRVTSPALTDIEVGRMDPADLVEVGSTVAGFLLRKSAKAEASLTA